MFPILPPSSLSSPIGQRGGERDLLAQFLFSWRVLTPTRSRFMHPGRKSRSRRSSRARGWGIGQKPIAVQNGRDPSSDHLERSLLKAFRFCVSRLAHQCYFGSAALLNCCIMIMIKSVDSLVTVSSQDLWTEICSSLPHPDLNEESNNAFADSFAESYVHVMENQMDAKGPSLQMNEKPWVPLKDSELYLASLERRLMRIKGLSQEVTSKDILHTLSQAKKESWDRFLQEKSESDFYMEGMDSDESTLEYLKRWLQPEKVAVSSEEIQYLIPLGAAPEKQEAEEDEEPTPVE